MKINKKIKIYKTGNFPLAILILICLINTVSVLNAQVYHSPFDCAYSPDETMLAVSDSTAKSVVILNASDGSKIKEVVLSGQPKGVAWADNNLILVSEYDNGTVAEVGVSQGAIVRRFKVGLKPVGLAVHNSTLFVANSGIGTVSVINLNTGGLSGQVAVRYQPQFIDITPDGSFALVTNLLPFGDATSYPHGSEVSFINLNNLSVESNVKLPHGSNKLLQIKCSPDGKWAYAVHTLGRVTLPTTHVDRGWTVTHGFTIIDVVQKKAYATLLLDRINEGAADPWGVDLSDDGNSLWVSLSGVHQVAKVDLKNLHMLIQGNIPSEFIANNNSNVPLWPNKRYKRDYTRPLSDIWFHIQRDPSYIKLLQNDMGALWGAGLLQIIRLPGQGPRGIAVSPSNSQVAVAAYYDGKVFFLDTSNGSLQNTVSLGSNSPESLVRKGERMFNDATTTKQSWLSCTTCHPGGRADGHNWDLLNDGIGNPKNAKSLLYTFQTPPVMSTGVREDAATAVNAGMKFIKFKVPEPGEFEALSAYLEEEKAEKSPYRVNGQFTSEALEGKALFEGSANCAGCHSGPYYTDLQKYDVGTTHELDKGVEEFDTPHLHELWKSAPYLHDGTAATLKEVFTVHNPNNRHGSTTQLTDQQLNNLVAFLQQIQPQSDTICGDVNNNGEVDILDALITAQHYVGLDVVIDLEAADVNNSNSVDILDALLITQFYVEIITELNCD